MPMLNAIVSRTEVVRRNSMVIDRLAVFEILTRMHINMSSHMRTLTCHMAHLVCRHAVSSLRF